MEPQSQNWILPVIGALLALSEVIALTKLKSNSVFQLIVNILKTVAGKKN